MLNMHHIGGNSVNTITSSFACNLLHAALLLGLLFKAEDEGNIFL
jgi:hypothetical protein